MTDYQMKAESGIHEVKGNPAPGVVERSAETWQFFAFVFAAVVTLAFVLLDETPLPSGWSRGLVKFGSFLVIGYCTLRSRRGRAFLMSLVDYGYSHVRD